MNYHRDKDYLENESTFRNIFLKRYFLMIRFIEAEGRVLDVGCSNGVFLDIFREKGWETWGVEPSGSGSAAKNKGHKIIKDTFEKAKLQEDYFDLIILNHTLEHLDNPLQVLTKIYKLLKYDGVLFVDVPNAGGLGAKLLGKCWPYRLPLEHKWQFTKQSLTVFLEKSGFKILHFESRSGIFEYANPFLELSRPRFLLDLFAAPYSLLATILDMGDSMSFIAKKI